MDDCGIPESMDFFKISRNIKKALWDCNHRGRVDVRGYGRNEVFGVPRFAGRDLVLQDDAGVYSPFPPEEASVEPMLKKVFVDVLAWALHNPSPAHILFIAGDMTLHNYGLLYNLKLSGYNILLGSRPKPNPKIIDHQFGALTSTLWYWCLLLQGKFPVTVSLPILPGSQEGHLEGVVSLKGRLTDLYSPPRRNADLVLVLENILKRRLGLGS
ncbi:unnamed protein product [Arabis nemorensis]|uniref:NYN domain-containing protein n=1 Tax=Arabis nemorensis TaxID=586526 RepID=A0A565BAP6_9BRAS|nr:unnamed protein product [Arabis nemorensis]